MSKQQEKLDQAARAAWMYYVANNTQHEIADHLGISRQMAQRLVAYAVEQGLVRVSVQHEITDCLALAEQMKARFGLSLCRVVPASGESEGLRRMLAVAGAEVMTQFLQSETPIVVNLGSGRTLKAVIDELTEIERPQHRIVSMVGAIATDGASNRYDVALRTAEKTGSKYFMLPAPLIADSAEDCRQWCSHRVYRVVSELSAHADVTFIGIGSVGPGCPLEEDGFLSKEEIGQLVSEGAAGEIIGHAVNHEGRPISSPITDRVTSLQLPTAVERPVIAFAGGASKYAALNAALRGKWLSGLVTDEESARQALAMTE
ncbi:sugar-binding transcriptional regulator [Silvimonas iriomotensis]|uniref:DNA-binding transcriptional regulator n=1 Tax=Silvimonas iriomotensis TaxID=449662 RepID=A0ABQ2P665_9NEIS|nr:sugar-binding transcriptional regulator [Silvimonas iriomotensis]GGP19248.1 DNA-binding transcriptional regulator [Silvimonas iriomotensis]